MNVPENVDILGLYHNVDVSQGCEIYLRALRRKTKKKLTRIYLSRLHILYLSKNIKYIHESVNLTRKWL